MSRKVPDRPTVPSPSQNDQTQPLSCASMLDEWTTHDWSQALDLATLPELAAIEVATKRSLYVIVRAGGGGREMLIKGGHYLPKFRRVNSIGCSLGGAMLKEHAVNVGFRMELAFEDRRLVTSEVTHIRVLPEGKA